MRIILSAIFSSILILISGNAEQIKYSNEEHATIQQEPIETVIAEQVEPIKKEPPLTTTQLIVEANWWSYPEEIKPTKRNGNDLLVLVNKTYQLPSSYAPSDLVLASNSGILRGENYYIRNILINDLKQLITDASEEDITLSIVSGYRSYSTQVNTYNFWVQYNGGDTDKADKISARAGHSQHQLGTTVDFSSTEVNNQLGVLFNNTNASLWLQSNAYKYGFVIGYPYGYENTTGYSYESWHYRYIGKANAQEMHDSGMILEIYLRSKN